MTAVTAPQTAPHPALDALAHLATLHQVPVPGTRVCWRTFGAGPALVLLHGGHGSWMHWVRNIGALAQRFTVWVADLPGYGDSDDVPPPGDLAALVRATVQSLDAVVGATTPIRLVGFSFGGLVATHVAQARPGVTQLALLGSAGHGTTRRPHGKLMGWKAAAAAGDAAAMADAMRHNLGVHMLHAQGADIDALALEVHSRSCRHTRFRSKEISFRVLIGPMLEALPTRLLLAWGAHDVTADPPAVMRTLAAAHAARDTRIIDGAGHWVQYEQADAVNALLLAWLHR